MATSEMDYMNRGGGGSTTSWTDAVANAKNFITIVIYNSSATSNRITMVIPIKDLSSSAKGYMQGYYGDNSYYVGVQAVVTLSSITFEYKKNGVDYSTGINVTYYYD